ncbi:alpha/beta fold hydrolase [Candidatus Marimicrobium litorale]|uniref:Alpha/beta hydrolase n=1 Tax=Candidatus Marimicrobium litorale TaxID=2518991 RepID=A0ABT3T4B7_9GAMM|nr:alpha/beta hydrolase [Candidatus Marimicrobium litorale]MCX2977128.1 alpha/beta hydrolase [Candidatus Marimicrobium litorale]
MRRLVTFLIWAIIALLLVAITAYLLARSGLKDMDQSARTELGGDYLETPRGILSYSRLGDEKAPAIILVHGFSTPKFVWDQITPELLKAGYQVIAYDHFGRGFSDRPEGPYNAGLYRDELSSLISGLQLTTPLALVGYSMGGANVVDYAATHPDQIKQLVLIAPAGYMGATDYASVLLAPGVGEWLFTVFGPYYAHSSIKAEVDAERAPGNMLTLFDAQAGYKGYSDALLSTLRHYPMGDFGDRYRALGATNIPVTAIWGTADSIVPYTGAALMADAVPQMELITLENGNHNITFGQPAAVADALLKALKTP